MIHETLHRKLKIEQHETPLKLGLDSCVGQTVPVCRVTVERYLHNLKQKSC